MIFVCVFDMQVESHKIAILFFHFFYILKLFKIEIDCKWIFFSTSCFCFVLVVGCFYSFSFLYLEGFEELCDSNPH